MRLDFLANQSKNPKRRSTRVYYPKDFVEGDERDVLVYMHGFGATADSYTSKVGDKVSVQEKISAIYAERKAREPVVLSFSMGATTIAGHRDHGADHPNFLPVEDFWSALHLSLDELPLQRRKLFFLANSAGAFSVFQMLRNIPMEIQVDAAVLCALPHFTKRGFAPNPAIQLDGTNLDPGGTLLRTQIEAIVKLLVADPHFASLDIYSALSDGSLPRNIPMLIQGGRWDALGYTLLNSQFSLAAAERGYPVSIREIPGGHASGIDNEVTVDFFLERP